MLYKYVSPIVVVCLVRLPACPYVTAQELPNLMIFNFKCITVTEFRHFIINFVKIVCIYKLQGHSKVIRYLMANWKNVFQEHLNDVKSIRT